MGKNNILDIANRWRDIWKPGSHPEGDGIKLHTIIEESMKVENIRKAHKDVHKKSENIKLLIQAKYYAYSL